MKNRSEIVNVANPKEMLNPRELRIGSSIQYKGALCQVLTISKTSIRCSIENDIEEDLFDTDDLEPIHLTEEWLVKFGFESSDCEIPDNSDEYRMWKDYWKGEFCIDYYHIGVDKRPDLFAFEFEGSWDIIKREIKYVHQLQNLYVALTGEELELKQEEKK